MSGRREKQRRRIALTQKPVQMYLAAAGRGGAGDFRARIPGIAGLEARVVSIAGVGAVGAPMALELARSLIGEVRLLDGDTVDIGTAVRWPLGGIAAGTSKVAILAQFIAQAYPRTRVLPIYRQLGFVGRDDGMPSEMEIMQQFMEGCDLLVDASAEFSVSYALSDLARNAGIAFLSLSATHGAWGGMIFSQAIEKVEPCWLCLQNYLASENGEVSAPPSDPAGLTQPEGCASPTFTGTSFDLLPVVAEATRTAVSILVPTYPRLEWNLAVLSLRDERGGAIAPHWATYQLGKHPDCENDRAH